MLVVCPAGSEISAVTKRVKSQGEIKKKVVILRIFTVYSHFIVILALIIATAVTEN